MGEGQQKRTSHTGRRLSQQELTGFIENASVGILWLMPDGRISWANRSMHELLGYTGDGLAGRRLAELLNDPGASREAESRLRSGETVRNLEVGLATVDGAVRYVLLSSSGLFKDGQLQYSCCMALDITERKRALEAVHEGEELYRHLAESMPQIVWTAGPDGRVDYCNRRWYEYTGLSEDQSLTRHRLDSVIHPDDKQAREEAWKRSIASGEPLEVEYRLKRVSDGQYRWHLGRAVPKKDADGRVTRWFGTSTDIDDQKVALRENKRLLEQVRAAAERQRSLLSEVLASVTGGRLCLCDRASELPEPLPMLGDDIELSAASLRSLRRLVEAIAEEREFPAERWEDLITAAGEAAMNAVNHAGGGIARVCTNGERLQVWIEDHGRGIEVNSLHRVTLQQGYTTADSFGHGFWLMLKTVDRFWLLTGPSGTTVVLEQDRAAPVPSWLRAYKPLAAE